MVVRDTYPTFRVDLTELFGRYVGATFGLDWLMRRAEPGPKLRPAPDSHASQVFVSAKSPRKGLMGAVATRLSILALKGALLVKVAQGRWAIVQVRDEALTALPFLIAARIGRTPFCYWMSFPIAEEYRHRALHEMSGKSPLKRGAALAYSALARFVLYRLVMPSSNHIFVQSERMKADIISKGVRPEKITPVPMGVNTVIHTPASVPPAPDPRLDGRRVLVYVGTTAPMRRMDLLVTALAQVAAAGEDVVLVIVGGSPTAEVEAIRSWARQAGVEPRVLFTGHLPLTEALGYVRRADVCISIYPTWPDLLLSGTPTKLVEYLAMGRPVVANDHPDQTLVLRESGAGLATTLDTKSISASILSLLRDKESAETAAAKGPRWVEAHRSYAGLSKLVVEQYMRLIG